MKRVLDYNPITGDTVYFDWGPEKLVITHSQDVSKILDFAQALASDTDYSKQGIKNDNWHYAKLPDVCLLEMKEKYHADWYDKNDTNHRHFFKVLNEHFSKFKTTDLVHN